MSERKYSRRTTRQTTQKSQPALKKQPRLRRPGGSSLSSTLNLPRTAARRRRRNRMPSNVRVGALLNVVFSPRWISLGILVAVFYAFNIVGTRTDFYLRYIPVEGAVSIDPQEIILASGLAGQHIFAADPNLAADQIAQIPGIVSAAVDLRWPNQISIQIEEDSPIAIWQTPDQSFWINQNLEILPARGSSGGLLVINAPSTAGLLGVEKVAATAADESASIPEEDLAEESEPEVTYTTGSIPEDLLVGAFLLQRLQPNGTTLNEVIYDARHGLSFEDSRGWMVHMGHGVDMPQKLAIYRAIIADLTSRGITPDYVSVSNKEKPFYSVAR